MKKNRFYNYFRSKLLKEFDNEKYWKRRMFLCKPLEYNLIFKIKRIFNFIYCKRIENIYNAYMGTTFKSCAFFSSIPNLPHGITGIFISCNSKIGNNCTLLQHCTIGESHGKSPILGDYVIVGTGARIIGGVSVGNKARIGANAVVVKDVKENTTIVLDRVREIIKDENYKISF